MARLGPGEHAAPSPAPCWPPSLASLGERGVPRSLQGPLKALSCLRGRPLPVAETAVPCRFSQRGHKFPWPLVNVFTTQIPAALRTRLPEARAHCSPKSQMRFLVWTIDLDQNRERATLPSLWEQIERAAPPAPSSPTEIGKRTLFLVTGNNPVQPCLLRGPPTVQGPCSTVRGTLSKPCWLPEETWQRLLCAGGPEPTCGRPGEAPSLDKGRAPRPAWPCTWSFLSDRREGQDGHLGARHHGGQGSVHDGARRCVLGPDSPSFWPLVGGAPAARLARHH